jgi:hypothetical protein
MNRPENIEDILKTLHSGQWWGWSDPNDTVYEKITVHDASKTLPTKEWLETELASQQAAYDNDYVRKRQEEYPSIEECVHAILDDDLVALQEKRTAVKTKYPKA